MYGDASENADVLSTAYGSLAPQIELSAQGQPVLNGAWEMTLRIGGREVELLPEWDCVCWHSDGDGDYLELQQALDGCRIERQVFLSRGGCFAMLADVVAEVPGATIEYCSRIPLAEGARSLQNEKTRECRIAAPGSTVARVFPLALPADPVRATPGSLLIADNRLELRQTATAAGLYAPLILDWEPERRRAAADWRPLTITEERKIIPADRASAFRLRMGQSHLLVYRSLLLTHTPRAVIGYNTRFETLVGWFNTAGEVVPLVQIFGI